MSRNRPVAAANSPKQSRLRTATPRIVQAAPSKTGNRMIGTMISQETITPPEVLPERRFEPGQAIQRRMIKGVTRRGPDQQPDDPDDGRLAQGLAKVEESFPGLRIP